VNEKVILQTFQTVYLVENERFMTVFELSGQKKVTNGQKRSWNVDANGERL
jgi:hypothetical protein